MATPAFLVQVPVANQNIRQINIRPVLSFGSVLSCIGTLLAASCYPRMGRPRKYLKLAERCRGLKDQARDNVSRGQLATLEHSYLTLAKSSRMLRRSIRLQRALERRHHK